MDEITDEEICTYEMIVNEGLRAINERLDKRS